MQNTTHGCVYEAKMIQPKNDNLNVHGHKPRNSNSFSLSSQRASKANIWNDTEFQAQHVAIKKVDKQILQINQNHKKNCNQDPDENIMKEAIILHYLSVMNKPPADNLCEFIEFIETDSDYYLIEQHGGIKLGTFVKSAHGYIQQKKLKLKHWRITAKFIFWQLSV